MKPTKKQDITSQKSQSECISTQEDTLTQALISEKESLLRILENPNDKLIAVDMDGTLCTGRMEEVEPLPIWAMVEKVTEWYKKGAHIIIYTGRPGETYNFTVSWLVKYRVPFHGLAMRIKPGADVYVDNRALNPDDL